MRIHLKPVVAAFAFSALFAFPFVAGAAPSFTNEPGIRLPNAFPQAVVYSTTGFRMYFLRDFKIMSATSTDQLTWSEEPSIRLSSATVPLIEISSVTGFSLLALSTGGYRALYSGVDSSGTYRICSATSADGYSWTNEIGTRVAAITTHTFVGSPRFIKVSNTVWRLFFVQNTDGGTAPANRQIYTSFSLDQGLTWSSSTVISAVRAGEVEVSSLTNARVRLVYTTPISGESVNSRVASELSNDSSASSFSPESSVRYSTSSADGAISFPVLARSTETFRWRLFFAFTVDGSTIPNVFSALTLSPSLNSISPNTVNRSDPPSTLTFNGEIFAPGPPAVKLTRAGQSDIPGTSSAYVNDQSVTASFDTYLKELGQWSGVLTNTDGTSATATNAFTITFAGGEVAMTDNLLRPRNGGQTQIAVQIFDAGKITVRLYTMDGQLLRTLFDQDVAAGTTTVFWDGKTEGGATVASGTYVVTVTGPKLDAVEKVVVIK